MRATDTKGNLKPIEDCYLIIQTANAGGKKITFKNLPDIGDQKDSGYTDESLPGRSLPSKIFSSGGGRTISLSFNLYAFNESELIENYDSIRAIQSATYPAEGDGYYPYIPPPMCALRCGELLSSKYGSLGGELCGVIKDYSVKFPNNVPWYSGPNPFIQYMPYKIEITVSFEVVYSARKLPGAEKIFSS